MCCSRSMLCTYLSNFYHTYVGTMYYLDGDTMGYVMTSHGIFHVDCMYLVPRWQLQIVCNPNRKLRKNMYVSYLFRFQSSITHKQTDRPLTTYSMWVYVGTWGNVEKDKKTKKGKESNTAYVCCHFI